MALRVLLADESSTIKKVIHLALQDFAVEVKAVHAGVDVLEVAKTFKPDIVFADVLLQKKNGYEVCGELKNDSMLKNTPVVLMWSSFMELDQAAYQKCRADGKLEKPFDVETIRKLVRDNVAKLRSQSLSDYLQFPVSISTPLREEESQRKASVRSAPPKVPDSAPMITPPAPNESSFTKTQLPPIPVAPQPPPVESVVANDDDDIAAGFHARDLTASQTRTAPTFTSPPIDNDSDEDWVKKDISRFTLDLPPIQLEGEDASISFDVHHGSIDGEKQITRSVLSSEPTSNAFNLSAPPPERTRVDEIALPDFENHQASQAHMPVMEEIEFNLTPDPAPAVSTKSRGSLDYDRELSVDELEKIVRAQSKEVIEQLVRKVVPEIATQLIKEEIDRLMAESAQ